MILRRRRDRPARRTRQPRGGRPARTRAGEKRGGWFDDFLDALFSIFD